MIQSKAENEYFLRFVKGYFIAFLNPALLFCEQTNKHFLQISLTAQLVFGAAKSMLLFFTVCVIHFYEFEDLQRDS